MLRGLAYFQTVERAERRQRRALDAAGRHAEPGRRPAGAAQPVRLAASPTGWPARSGRSARATRRSTARRPGDPAFAALPRATGSTSRSARCSGRRSRATAPTGRSTARRPRPGWSSTAPTRAPRRCSAWRPTSRAGGPTAARDALRKLAEGIAQMGGGDARTLAVRRGAAVGAVAQPTGTPGRSQMPAALARASTALGDTSLAAPAARDSATFDPWLLTSGGPDNGRLPTRIDARADRLRRRLAAAVAARDRRRRPARPASAGWPASSRPGTSAPTPPAQPAYDPATGRTVDGVAGRRHA